MERRREPRIACYQTAWLTLLTTDDRAPIGGRAIQISGHGMRVILDEPIPVGAPVSIETGDWLALGEVCYCGLEYAHFAVGLQLEEFLPGLQELEVTRNNWLEETVSSHAGSLALDVL
jgi:hypothetical protein